MTQITDFLLFEKITLKRKGGVSLELKRLLEDPVSEDTVPGLRRLQLGEQIMELLCYGSGLSRSISVC